ncbi:hypothetical protein MRS44_009523 [Fusarium solani]|uniref:uncharacterized protein n=1 Tax=Fusarium solani TaxID=169388 RepID=UPI0032C4820D|nr:hypothetical protein MRS44_009523 [Fusarium solani]
MLYHRIQIGLVLVCMVGVALADPWDDFANNLFTDLAPLLALFGERTTMQFMSQALGWEDCVILAMAPLGIITILVSAIRVGGPAWLKAIVGRARENMSAAEMELMSSTSKEVCELYNGQTIVRCQGSAPVWEFIYLVPIAPRKQDPTRKFDIKAITLEDACKEDKKLLHQLASGMSSQHSRPSGAHQNATIFSKIFARPPLPRNNDVSMEQGVEREPCSEQHAQASNETIYVIRNMSSDAPNIILNLHNNNNNQKELQVCATIGVILQLCVLIFFSIITYHPTIRKKFPRDDRRVDDYAFPLAVGGTLVLALGVLVCGSVVERSTREIHYKRNDKYEMRVIWIQQKQTVGDQVFEPYATFPDSPRDIISMSRRCNASQAQALGPLAIIGVLFGLSGFIVQFIGLRAMNSAATLAQLGAVGIMTAIRAWVRRQLARPPQQEKLASGFELDVLAWALAFQNDSRDGASGSTASMVNRNISQGRTREMAKQRTHVLMQRGNLGWFMNLEKQKKYSWIISTGGNVEHQPFLQYRVSSNSKPQQILETRRSLTRLAQFRGPSATEAINLAMAMEKVMSLLFPLDSGGGEKVWTWPLAIVYRDPESAESLQCHVFFSLIGKDGTWKVLADQLEPVLSLCLFTAHRLEEDLLDGVETAFKLSNEDDDWLRQKTMSSGLGIRLLGSTDAKKTGQLIQDLRWWAPETFETLSEIQEVNTGVDGDKNTEGPVGHQNNPPMPPTVWRNRQEVDQIFKSDPKFDSLLADSNRVVGYGPALPQLLQNSKRQRHFRNFSVCSRAQKMRLERGTLAIESNDSLEKLYAKDLLYSFLLSAAKSLPKPLQSQVIIRETAADSRINGTPMTLETSEISSLAAEFGRLGYGTEQEVRLSIIAPLSMAERLSFPRPLFDFTRDRAQKMRREHKWLDATREYLKLWDQTQRHTSSTQSICGWGTALLMEHYRDIEDEMKLESEYQNEPRFLKQASQEVRSKLQSSKHHPDFFTHLLRIYEKQGRPAMTELVQDMGGSNQQHSFPDYFGVTALHLKVLECTFYEEDVIGAEKWEMRDIVNERDMLDWTPLYYAAVRGNQRLVMSLLQMGADPNLKDLHGFTPVHYACQHGGQDLIWTLQRKGGTRRGNLRPIKSLFGWGQESLFKLRDYNGRLPVHWAVIYGHKDVVWELKSTIDEPDMYGWTSLHLATMYHERGSDLLQTVLQLSTEREAPDRKSRTPLILACEKGNLQAVHELIHAGVNVNATMRDGVTALHCAIVYGSNSSLVQALVDKGAKMNTSTKAFGGLSPFHLAAQGGHDVIMGVLLSALDDLDPDARSLVIGHCDNEGQTALHVAASFSRLEVIKLLLAAGADPERIDKRGATPLHSALKGNKRSPGLCLKVVKMLVENNGNPRARDDSGRMPLDVALEMGHAEVGEYLRECLESREYNST